MKTNDSQLQTSLRPACMAGAFIILFLILFLARPDATNAATPVAISKWNEVASRTACEAMNPRYCVGIYGFTINDRGHFIVGPNPAGKTLEGELSTDEFAQLKAHADAVAADVAADPTGKCESGRRIMGTADAITLTVDVKAYAVATAPNAICSYNGDTVNTKQLIADVQRLRQKYYVTPF